MCQSIGPAPRPPITRGRSLRSLISAAVAALALAACGLPPPDEEGLPEPPAPALHARDDVGAGVAIHGRDGTATGTAPHAQDPRAPADLTGCEHVRVVDTGGVTLNVRPDPSTSDAPVGQLAEGQVVETVDIVDGEAVSGVTTWYEIDTGALSGFVSGAFAACVDASAPPGVPASTYLLPLACGASRTVTQGNNTSFSHNGSNAYAFDFGLTLNTPLHAVHGGTVIYKDTSTQPGDPCYSGGGSSCINEANYITIDNGDGTDSLYAHINSSALHVGDHVERGDVVALSGGTGWSTGPHAHVMRQNHCGIWFCQSVPMHFGDVAGDGVPVGGDVVTSQNCP